MSRRAMDMSLYIPVAHWRFCLKSKACKLFLSARFSTWRSGSYRRLPCILFRRSRPTPNLTAKKGDRFRKRPLQEREALRLSETICGGAAPFFIAIVAGGFDEGPLRDPASRM